MYPRFKFTAATLAVLTAFNAYAQSSDGQDFAVVVTATRIPGISINPAQDATVVHRDRIEENAGRSVAETIAQEAGVEIATTGGPTSVTSIFIRGTKPAQSATLIDGFRLVNPTNGTAPLQEIPLQTLERVEVIRGAASGLYGSGAIGGVVQMFTRAPDRQPAFDASITLGRYDSYLASGGYGGTVGKTSFYAGFGLDGSQGFSATKPGNISFEADKDGYRRQSFVGSVQHELNEDHSLRLTSLYAHNHTDVDLGATTSPYVVSKTRLLGLTYDGRLSNTWRTNVRVGVTSYDYEYKQAGFTWAPRTENQQFGWLNYFALPVGTLMLGFEREEQRVTGDGTSYLHNRRNIDSGLLQWVGTLGNHKLQANLRSDRWTDYGTQTNGGILYAYAVTPAVSLTASAATAFRAPTFDDLYFPFGSNPNLKPEHARNLELGTRYKVAGDEIRLVAFRNRIRDAIELDAFWMPQNVQAEIKGGTLSWQHVASTWRWNASYTYQDPRDTVSHNRLIRRARNLASVSVERTLGAWRLGGELRAQDGRYDSLSNAPSSHMGGYAVTNLYASYDLSKDLRLLARLDNIADKHYEVAQFYNVPGRALSLTLSYSPK